MTSWICSIHIAGEDPLHDIRLDTPTETKGLIPDGPLTYLATVDATRIPLALRWGPVLAVKTDLETTEAWFTQALSLPATTDDGDDDAEHPFGILVSTARVPSDIPQTTEILFFLTKTGPSVDTSNSGSSTYELKALCLSSDLLKHLQTQSTPPLSPNNPSSFPRANECVFLDTPQPGLHIPATRKRKTALQAFDIAADRLKRRKRTTGAETSQQSQPPVIALPKPEQSISSSRPQSRVSSAPIAHAATLTSGPPPAVGAGKEGGISSSSSSSLAQLKPNNVNTNTTNTVNTNINNNPIEERNRDTISRLVLAGMRMHGVTKEHGDEYKLVYHNTLKAVVFAFRRQIAQVALQTQVGALQERVDVLLDLFCCDPLPQI